MRQRLWLCFVQCLQPLADANEYLQHLQLGHEIAHFRSHIQVIEQRAILIIRKNYVKLTNGVDHNVGIALQLKVHDLDYVRMFDGSRVLHFTECDLLVLDAVARYLLDGVPPLGHRVFDQIDYTEAARIGQSDRKLR